MTTLPEEAVKAAMDAFHLAWNNNQGLDNELPAYAHRAALTAALPFLSALEPSAARELALEEIIALCKDYAEDSQPDSEYRLACNDIIEALQERRALSSPDHIADAGKLVEGDGWRPIESAPKDGTEIIYLTKYGSIGFCRYAVDDINDWFGWWDLQADDEVYPKRWVPRSALPSAPSGGVE